MGLKSQRTSDGGVFIEGDMKHASVYVEWDSDENLVSERCTIKPRGLGDTIAKATKLVGMKPCSKCEKRRKLLNKFVPYRSSP